MTIKIQYLKITFEKTTGTSTKLVPVVDFFFIYFSLEAAGLLQKFNRRQNVVSAFYPMVEN